jgi:hypothetical protein
MVEDIQVVQVVGNLPVDLLEGKTSQFLMLCSQPLSHPEKKGSAKAITNAEKITTMFQSVKSH